MERVAARRDRGRMARPVGGLSGRMKTSFVPAESNGRVVRDRAVAAAREHAASGGVIVLCTHGGAGSQPGAVGGRLARRWQHLHGKLGTLGNTSITTIEIRTDSRDEVRLVGFNDVGHLTGATLDLRLPFDPVSRASSSRVLARSCDHSSGDQMSRRRGCSNRPAEPDPRIGL